jgi:ethanolamine transporter
MNFVSVFMAFFSVLGAADRILGNRFGLGKEFEKGMMLMGNVSLSMIGMIVISPFISSLLGPAFTFVRDVLHLEPSIIPASLFANDMGGASMAVQVAADQKMGLFNALVVSAMMGCTVSFNIPYALGVVKPEKNNELFLGFLCGIVTIPVGCFVAGLVLKIAYL